MKSNNVGIAPPPPESLTHPKYRPDIDGLRAIAVLSVLVFHAFPHALKGGFIGVDVFFVISGFLISTIIFSNLDRGSFSFVAFYSRRIKRIFPALLLVLMACLVLGWFVLLADEYQQLSKHAAGGAGFIANFLFWNESGYFDNAAETKLLLHLWSLGIEEQFYIVWPLLIWWAWRKGFNLLSITVVIALVSFVLNVRTVRHDAIAAFYSPQTRFWELLVGSVLAYVSLHPQRFIVAFKHKFDVWLGQCVYAQVPVANGMTLRNVQSLLGALFILAGVLLVSKERFFPGWWALLPTLGALLLISAGMQAWFNRKVLAHRVLVWFGLISFPLYLWHWPLLTFARIMEGDTPSRAIRAGAVLVAILLAWMTYQFVEKPIRFGQQGKQKTILLLLCMTVVGVGGYATYTVKSLKKKPVVAKEFANAPSNIKHGFNFDCSKYAPELYGLVFMGLCKLSKDEPPSIAFIGDSHTGHFKHAAWKVSESESVLMVVHAGCLPFYKDYYRVDCEEQYKAVKQYLKNSTSIRTVILSGY